MRHIAYIIYYMYLCRKKRNTNNLIFLNIMKNNIKYLVLNTESEITNNALVISNASNPSVQGYIEYLNCYLGSLDKDSEFLKQGFHLISITSTENEEEGDGLHTLIFYSDNQLITREEQICTLELHKAFPLDYEASLIAPTVTYTNNTYIVTHPYTL